MNWALFRNIMAAWILLAVAGCGGGGGSVASGGTGGTGISAGAVTGFGACSSMVWSSARRPAPSNWMALPVPTRPPIHIVD